MSSRSDPRTKRHAATKNTPLTAEKSLQRRTTESRMRIQQQREQIMTQLRSSTPTAAPSDTPMEVQESSERIVSRQPFPVEEKARIVKALASPETALACLNELQSKFEDYVFADVDDLLQQGYIACASRGALEECTTIIKLYLAEKYNMFMPTATFFGFYEALVATLQGLHQDKMHSTDLMHDIIRLLQAILNHSSNVQPHLISDNEKGMSGFGIFFSELLATSIHSNDVALLEDILKMLIHLAPNDEWSGTNDDGSTNLRMLHILAYIMIPCAMAIAATTNKDNLSSMIQNETTATVISHFVSEVILALSEFHVSVLPFSNDCQDALVELLTMLTLTSCESAQRLRLLNQPNEPFLDMKPVHVTLSHCTASWCDLMVYNFEQNTGYESQVFDSSIINCCVSVLAEMVAHNRMKPIQLLPYVQQVVYKNTINLVASLFGHFKAQMWYNALIAHPSISSFCPISILSTLLITTIQQPIQKMAQRQFRMIQHEAAIALINFFNNVDYTIMERVTRSNDSIIGALVDLLAVVDQLDILPSNVGISPLLYGPSGEYVDIWLGHCLEAVERYADMAERLYQGPSSDENVDEAGVNAEVSDDNMLMNMLRTTNLSTLLEILQEEYPLTDKCVSRMNRLRPIVDEDYY